MYNIIYMQNNIVNNIYYNKYMKYKERYITLDNLYGGEGEDDDTVSLTQDILIELAEALKTISNALEESHQISELRLQAKQYIIAIKNDTTSFTSDILLTQLNIVSKASENLHKVSELLLNGKKLLIKSLYQILISSKSSTSKKLNIVLLKIRELISETSVNEILNDILKLKINDNITRGEKYVRSIYATRYINAFNTIVYNYHPYLIFYYNTKENTNIWNLTDKEIAEEIIFLIFGEIAKIEFNDEIEIYKKNNRRAKIEKFPPIAKYSIKKKDTLKSTSTQFSAQEERINYNYYIVSDEIEIVYGQENSEDFHRTLRNYRFVFDKIISSDENNYSIWDLSISNANFSEIFNSIINTLFENSSDIISNFTRDKTKFMSRFKSVYYSYPVLKLIIKKKSTR